jgi:hypothetical protein
MSSSNETESGYQATEMARALLAALRCGAALEGGLLRDLFAAVARLYVDQIRAGEHQPFLGQEAELTATEAMILTTEVLRAADLQLFELGMWQALGGPN